MGSILEVESDNSQIMRLVAIMRVYFNFLCGSTQAIRAWCLQKLSVPVVSHVFTYEHTCACTCTRMHAHTHTDSSTIKGRKLVLLPGF